MSKLFKVLVALALVVSMAPSVFLFIRALVLNCQEQLDELLFNFAIELGGAAITYILFSLVIDARMNREAELRAEERQREAERRAEERQHEAEQRAEERQREAEQREREEEKERLIGEMGSIIHDRAVTAAEELGRRGWLQDGSLQGRSFAKAALMDAKLSGAVLIGADLRYADLNGADLSSARLQGAMLWGTDFENADLTGANLTGAELNDSSLLDAKGLTDEQLATVLSLRGATMASGSHYNGRFSLEMDLVTAHRFMKVGTSDEAMAGFYGVTVEAYQWGQKWNKWSKSPPVPPIPHEEPMSPEYIEWLKIQDDPDKDFSESGWVAKY